MNHRTKEGIFICLFIAGITISHAQPVERNQAISLPLLRTFMIFQPRLHINYGKFITPTKERIINLVYRPRYEWKLSSYKGNTTYFIVNYGYRFHNSNFMNTNRISIFHGIYFGGTILHSVNLQKRIRYEPETDSSDTTDTGGELWMWPIYLILSAPNSKLINLGERYYPAANLVLETGFEMRDSDKSFWTFSLLFNFYYSPGYLNNRKNYYKETHTVFIPDIKLTIGYLF